MPGEENKFVGDKCFVITNPSHKHFYLYGTDPDEIQIVDIANSVSKQCRWVGHLAEDKWFSTAEHMVTVAEIVRHLGGALRQQRQALLHDAPEAYLSDIAAPFKHELGNYYEKENLIWTRIAAKFDVDVAMDPLVKHADWLSLYLEVKHFVFPEDPTKASSFVGYDQYAREAWCLPIEPLGLDYRAARIKYLHAYDVLFGGA